MISRFEQSQNFLPKHFQSAISCHPVQSHCNSLVDGTVHLRPLFPLPLDPITYSNHTILFHLSSAALLSQLTHPSCFQQPHHIAPQQLHASSFEPRSHPPSLATLFRGRRCVLPHHHPVSRQAGRDLRKPSQNFTGHLFSHGTDFSSLAGLGPIIASTIGPTISNLGATFDPTT